MGRHISQQAVEFGHSVGGGAGLGAGEVAGGGEDPPVDTPAIVQQIAYGYLEFFALGRCSEGGQVGRGTLRRGGAIVGRGIEGRGGGWFDAKGAETLEERVDVSGVGDGEGALGGVVLDGGAQELVGDGVGLDVIEGRQGRDKEIEVGAIGVLDTEIVDNEDKGYGTGEVTKQARGGRLDKARLKQKGDEAALT
jgi:hypothetical protein